MISLIICTYNRCESLKVTLNSLAQLSVPPDLAWELIVVDNNSEDDTRSLVEDFAQRSGLDVHYVRETQQGQSYARNKGIRTARGNLIVFTDDDVTFDKSWLSQIRYTFANSDALGLGGKIIPLWMTPKPQWYYDSKPYSLGNVIVQFDLGDRVCETTQTPFGANMAFRKEAFHKYGFFRTDLGRTKNILIAGEDSDFFRRLIKAGERVIYTPHAIVYHPVEKARANKTYVQSWYFSFGRAQIRTEGVPNDAVRYFGVPRYMFRMLTAGAVKWFFAFESKNRLRHKVQVYCIAGMITEARKAGVRAAQ